MPLCFVIFVGLLKELIADLNRWSQDRQTNMVLYSKLSDKNSLEGIVRSRSDRLKVGDILMLNDDEIVPADCILLHTVEKHGECFVQTA